MSTFRTRSAAALMSLLVLVLGLVAGSGPVRSADADPSAAGPTALDGFLAGLKNWRAQFTQSTLETSGKSVEQGAGTLVVSRPDRFRWEFTPLDAGAQLLIADGRNLWFYDRELQQATVKSAAAALSATPIVLLSGTSAELRSAFSVLASGEHDALRWVQVTPRLASADFASAELGFRGGQLSQLVIHDRLGQIITLRFTHSERNGRVADSELRFVPPAGVDVIGTAQAP